VSAHRRSIVRRERNVATARPRLRSHERIAAVGGADSIERAANVDDAGREVESVLSPREREQLAEPESGREREADQRACEAAAEALVVGRGGAHDRLGLLRREDAGGPLRFGVDRHSDARARARFKVAICLASAAERPKCR